MKELKSMNGMNNLDMSTKNHLRGRLDAKYAQLLAVMPDEATDIVDRFIFHSVDRLAIAAKFSGNEGIQARLRLEYMSQMTYENLRQAATQSPDYFEFKRTHAVPA